MIKNVVLRICRLSLGGCGGSKDCDTGLMGGDNTLWILSFYAYHRYMQFHLFNMHDDTLIIEWHIFLTDGVGVVILIITIVWPWI